MWCVLLIGVLLSGFIQQITHFSASSLQDVVVETAVCEVWCLFCWVNNAFYNFWEYLYSSFTNGSHVSHTHRPRSLRHHAGPVLLRVPQRVGSDDHNSICQEQPDALAFPMFLCTRQPGSSSFFHGSSRWCPRGDCCCVRFWNVFVIFTGSKPTPVSFLAVSPIIDHLLSQASAPMAEFISSGDRCVTLTLAPNICVFACLQSAQYRLHGSNVVVCSSNNSLRH